MFVGLVVIECRVGLGDVVPLVLGGAIVGGSQEDLVLLWAVCVKKNVPPVRKLDRAGGLSTQAEHGVRFVKGRGG